MSSQSSEPTSPDTALRKYLTEAGFYIHRPKHMPYEEAVHQERGIAVRWQHKEPFCYSIRMRPVAGSRRFTAYGDYGPEVDIQFLSTLRGAPKSQKRVTLANMPEPFQFVDTEFVTTANHHGDFWWRQESIDRCRVVGLVAVTESGEISAEEIATPDKICWYHLECLSREGALFVLVSDGEVWYPINQKTRKVTTNLHPKKSVDLTKMCAIDKELINIAIEDFTEQMFPK